MNIMIILNLGLKFSRGKNDEFGLEFCDKTFVFTEKGK